MARLFSFASWNVEQFAGKPDRFDRVVDFLNSVVEENLRLRCGNLQAILVLVLLAVLMPAASANITSEATDANSEQSEVVQTQEGNPADESDGQGLDSPHADNSQPKHLATLTEMDGDESSDSHVDTINDLSVENSLLKSFQNDLINTVYFSLGTVVTIFILLAGLNWFANFRIYENDKKRLLESVDSRLEARLGPQSQELERLKLETLEEVDSKLERRFETLSNSFVTKETYRDERKVLEDEVKRLVMEIAIAEFSLRLVEKEVWTLKEVYGNVLITLSQALRAGLELPDSWMPVTALDEMEETLAQSFVGGENAILESTKRNVERGLQAAEEKYPIKVAKIRALLEQVKIDEDPNED